MIKEAREEGPTVRRDLALELVSTIRHDGQGGVTDDLADLPGLTDWIRDRADLFDGWTGARGFVADESSSAEVVALRQAVRALFARAVSPAPPSRADADRLPPAEQALARVNAAAAGQPVTPRLDWPTGAAPASRLLADRPDPTVVGLTAALARAAIAFLTGPQRDQLRACAAPRCVRYFVREHGRQEWCKPACGNRARAARHYQRHHSPSANPPKPQPTPAPPS